MTTNDLAQRLLDWYSRHARQLPWRGHPDPYAIWVSEVMLQQTRVETVIPYFERWMELFPGIADLAAAPLEAVLKAWEGLGYYRRAKHLHQAAKMIVKDWGGKLPANPDELRRLPGVGRYTAGAIASLAFGKDVPALDGNVRRVLARVFNVTVPSRSPEGERILWKLAADNLPGGQAADYNQALMDLGALVCTPSSPDCANCPIEQFCQACTLGVQDHLPIMAKAKATPHHIVTAAVIWRDESVLIAQRPMDGLLGGLWEFPGGKLEPGEDLVSCLQRELREELNVNVQVVGAFGVYKHAYTHFRVTLHAFICSLPNGAQPESVEAVKINWVKPAELELYPMGKIDRQISNKIIHSMDSPDAGISF